DREVVVAGAPVHLVEPPRLGHERLALAADCGRRELAADDLRSDEAQHLVDEAPAHQRAHQATATLDEDAPNATPTQFAPRIAQLQTTRAFGRFDVDDLHAEVGQ